ncbi:MAG: DNA gyrase inhibitor YacG [Acidobacteriota bacterium]
MRVKTLKCPTCGQRVSRKNPFLPFCSGRCRLIDLGQWIDGKYRVAGKPVPSPELTGEEE